MADMGDAINIDCGCAYELDAEGLRRVRRCPEHARVSTQPVSWRSADDQFEVLSQPGRVAIFAANDAVRLPAKHARSVARALDEFTLQAGLRELGIAIALKAVWMMAFDCGPGGLNVLRKQP